MALPATSGSSSRVGSCPRSVPQSSGRTSRSGSRSPLSQQQGRGSTTSSLRRAGEGSRAESPATYRDAEAAGDDAAVAGAAREDRGTAAAGASEADDDCSALPDASRGAAEGTGTSRTASVGDGSSCFAAEADKRRPSNTVPPSAAFQFVSSRLRAQAERQAAAAATASSTTASHQSTSSSSSSIDSSGGTHFDSPCSAFSSSPLPSNSSNSFSSVHREGGSGGFSNSSSNTSSAYSTSGAAAARRGGLSGSGRSGIGNSSNSSSKGINLWAGSSSSSGGRGGRRSGGMWCYICRDGVQRGEENVVECGACPKRFHVECLQQEGLLQPNQQQCGLARGSGGAVVIQGEWLCPQCEEEQEDDEMQNDERCFICKKKEADSEDRLLLCDGCPNSYHMRSCLKMTIEPDEEKWFCPECNPAAFKRDEVRRLGRRGVPGIVGMRGSAAVDGGRGGSSTEAFTDGSSNISAGSPPTECIVNASSCYVCQRPGKLLGCDFCPNSFHPACLVDVDWNSIGEEWECPVCRGQDPLANQMHKRWTRAEIEVKRKERSKCLLRIRAKTVRYRNRFLLVHQKDLGPFVHPKVWSNLVKSLRAQVGGSAQQSQQHSGALAQKRGGGAGGGRLQVERSMADLLEGLEDEAMEECAKFVKRAYRATRYPSGRKIEGVPLREGIELKPHQEEGVEWLLCSFMTGGGILADEMGLGKTIQTLCFLSYLNAMKLEGPHLIVVPLSTVGNWMREVHRFTPSLTHIKICGSRAERQHALDDRLAQRGLYDLYITTYETVKSEEEFFVEVIPHWQCIVLDEAHRIKNASGGIRHALDRVVGNMRLLLTGTPLQNSAAELFTLINFLMPDVFRDSQLIEQAFLSAQQQQQLLASGQALQPHYMNSQQQQQHGGGSSRGGSGTARGGAGGASGGGSSGSTASTASAGAVAANSAQGATTGGSTVTSPAGGAPGTPVGAVGGGSGAAGAAAAGSSSGSGPAAGGASAAGGLEVEQLFRQEDLEKIRNLLDRVMLRRLKEQAIALPKKTFHSVWLPLSGTAAAWYERLLRIRALQEASKERLHESSYRKMLGLVIKMRIICAHPKALCARESQMQRLQALFLEEEAATQQEVMEAAQKLQQLEGEQHVRCSAKLCFLDKLLCHLHDLNCRFVPGYEREYDNHRREAATYKFYKQHEEKVKEAIAAGRKPPRRPKRVELPGLAAFQLLLQKGDPRLAGVKAAADPSYLEESMYAAELVMPVVPERATASAAEVGEEKEQQKQQQTEPGGRESKTLATECASTDKDTGSLEGPRKQEKTEQGFYKKERVIADFMKHGDTGRSKKCPYSSDSAASMGESSSWAYSNRGGTAAGVKSELTATHEGGGGKQQLKLQIGGGANGGITLLREKKSGDKSVHAEQQICSSAGSTAEARRKAATVEAARAATLAIDEEEEEQLPRTLFSSKKKRGVIIVDEDEREKSISAEPSTANMNTGTHSRHSDSGEVLTPSVSPRASGTAAGAEADILMKEEKEQELHGKNEAPQKHPDISAGEFKAPEGNKNQDGRPIVKKEHQNADSQHEAAEEADDGAKREEEGKQDLQRQSEGQQHASVGKAEKVEEEKLSPRFKEEQKKQQGSSVTTGLEGKTDDTISNESLTAARKSTSVSPEAGGDTTVISGSDASPLQDPTSDSGAAVGGMQQQQPRAKVQFEIDRSQPRLQRLLVFTQFQLVLDELETYCQFRGWKYLRLDGSTNKFVRELDIRDFNSENSTYFVYLISTRAGGLGINLTAANHVVLYDHDWNPFIDLQAVDRAHRIGQQREVHVWSLVNEWTVEERMAFRRDQKLRLDKLLVQHQQEEGLEVDDEESKQNRGEKISTDEIRRLMLHGRKAIMEVAAKRPIEIFDCSLEELASRQRLRLPELGSGAAGGSSGVSGSGSSGGAEEGAGADEDTTGDGTRRRDGDDEEGDGDSREEETEEDQELVDIDEVMNEEAEEQLKQQQLLEAADGVSPDDSSDNSTRRDAGGGGSSSSSGSASYSASSAEARTTVSAAGGRMTSGAVGENEFSAAASSPQAANGDTTEEATAVRDGKAAGGGDTATGGAGGPPLEKNTSNSCGASSPSTKGDLEKELQSAGVLWRSGRERKKPTAVYVPQEFGQREERKKIRHEQRCFICGQSRDFEQVVTDAEGKQHKITLGDLVPCSGCPRAYHRECEGLGKDVKKSWRCRWHECCLCFRKTSQCGNMLIHCARCPTSFCYDCFPPDYCRYNVGEEYYSQLRQRGMNVTPQNWILLLCSRCKAVEEQQTRRRLTKEEKEQEKQQQKELRQQQKELHEGLETKGRTGGGSSSSGKEVGGGGPGSGGAVGETGVGVRHRAEEERRFFENKHRVDALEAKQEEELRQAYQRLFPAAFVEELHKRVHAAKAAQKMNREASLAMQAQAAAAALAEGRRAAQEAAASVDDEQQKLQAAVAAAQVAAANAKKAQQQKRPVNQLVNMKLPAASLGLCDNCRLPCHGVKDYPGSCCFPPEVVSKFFVRNAGGSGSALPTLKDGATTAGESTQQESEQEASGEKAVEGEGGTTASAEDLKHQTNSSSSCSVDDSQAAAPDTPTCNGVHGADGSGPEHPAGGDTANTKKLATPVTATAGASSCLSPELKNLLASAEGVTGTPISAATAAELTAANIDSVKVVHKQVCGCCGECRTGKRSHLRKHCLSLSEEDKAKYAERRELVQQLVKWLLQQTPIPDTAPAGYATASPQRLKGYYQQYQTQADRVVEEGMMAVGLGAAVSQRSYARRPYNTITPSTPGLAVRGGSAASVSATSPDAQTPLQSPQPESACGSVSDGKTPRPGSAGTAAGSNGPLGVGGGDMAAAATGGTSVSPTAVGGSWSGPQKSRKRAAHTSPTSTSSSTHGPAAATTAAAGGAAGGTASCGASSGKKRPLSGTGSSVIEGAALGDSSSPTASGSESAGSHFSRKPSSSQRYGNGKESVGLSDVELLGMMHASQNVSLHAHQHAPGTKMTKTLGANAGNRRGPPGVAPRASGGAPTGPARCMGGGAQSATVTRVAAGDSLGSKGGVDSGAGSAGGSTTLEEPAAANDKLLVTNPWNSTTSPVMLPASGNAAVSGLLHAKDACALGVKLLQAATAGAAGPLMRGDLSAAAAAATAASLAAGMHVAGAGKRPGDNGCKAPTTAKKARGGSQCGAAGGAASIVESRASAAGSRNSSVRLPGPVSRPSAVAGLAPGVGGSAGEGSGAGLDPAAFLKRRKSPFPHTRETYTGNNIGSGSDSGAMLPQNVPAALDSSGLHNNAGAAMVAPPQPPAAPAPFKQQKSIIDFFLTKTKGGVPITSNSLSYAADNLRTNSAAPVGGPLAALAALVAARTATGGAPSPPPPASSSTLGGGYR